MSENFKQKIKLLLLWSQRWTKTDMLYAARGGAWITFEKIIFNAVGAISFIAFANFLTRENYGIYQYVISVTAIFSIFSLPGIDSATVFAVAAGREGSYSDALRKKIKFGLLGGLAALAFSIYYFWQGNSILGLSFALASVFIPFVDSFLIYNALLLGKKEFRHYSSNNILEKVKNWVE